MKKDEVYMKEKQKFKATIAGKVYTIVGQKDPTHLKDVVDIINNQLNQLSELAPELSYSDRSILMSVNAVSDQLTKEAQIIQLEKEVKKLKEELTNYHNKQLNYQKNHSIPKAALHKNNNQSGRKFKNVPFERKF